MGEGGAKFDLPHKTPLIGEPIRDSETVRKFKKADASKLLTGRTPEQTMEDGNSGFNELYGMNRSTKAFLEFFPDAEKDFGIWVPDVHVYETDEKSVKPMQYIGLDILCLENARVRKQVRTELSDKTADEVDTEVLRRMLHTYKPTAEANDATFATLIRHYRDDRILNIGDPWRKVNIVLDEPRTTTIDYETGEQAGAGNTRVVTDVTLDLRHYLDEDKRITAFTGALHELEEGWGDVEPGKDYDTDWLWDPRALPEDFFPEQYSYTTRTVVEEEMNNLELQGLSASSIPTGESPPVQKSPVGSVHEETSVDGYRLPIEEVRRVYQAIISGKDIDISKVGIVQLTGIAKRLSEHLEIDPSSDNMHMAKQAWEAVEMKIAQRRQHYLETTGKDISTITYDQDYGLHPIDYLTKSARLSAGNAVKSIEVLDYYRQHVFPKVIHDHLEDLADIHTRAYSGDLQVDEHDFAIYKNMWDEFISSRDFDPKTYNPFDEDSKFVDMLIDFFQLRGIRIAGLLDPAFKDMIKAEEDAMILNQFPVKMEAKEAKFVQAMFPFTQELPNQGYDRVVASWSVSAHMMPKMTTEELVEKVWPELDRLLCTGGRATFFPIGHYGESPEWIRGTIEQYIKKSGSSWSIDISKPTGQSRWLGDDQYEGDVVLVITKQ